MDGQTDREKLDDITVQKGLVLSIRKENLYFKILIFPICVVLQLEKFLFLLSIISILFSHSSHSFGFACSLLQIY